MQIRYQSASGGVYERGLRKGLFYWTEDEVPFWFELWAEQAAPPRTAVSFHVKTREPWPEAHNQVSAGAIQRFEGGIMLAVTGADRQRVVLVLYYTSYPDWAVFPEVPFEVLLHLGSP